MIEEFNADVCAAEYRRLGYDAGYVLGMTPLANIETAEVVLVGLNPGGDGENEVRRFPPEMPTWDLSITDVIHLSLRSTRYSNC